MHPLMMVSEKGADHSVPFLNKLPGFSDWLFQGVTPVKSGCGKLTHSPYLTEHRPSPLMSGNHRHCEKWKKTVRSGVIW